MNRQAPVLLIYCRPGFENDAAAELIEIAHACGDPGWCRALPGAGFLTLHASDADATARLWRRVRWRDLVFARQWLYRFAALDALPGKDRATPVARAATAHLTEIGRLNIDWPDTNEGKGMARFARRFHGPVERALAADGVVIGSAGAMDLHLFMTDSANVQLALTDPSNSNPVADGVHRLRLHPEAPSRSALKLDEALLALVPDTVSAGIGPGVTAVDLGAAPGGWSWQLARRGVTVTAVDNGPMASTLLDGGLVTHIRADGFVYRPPRPVQWLVCDIVEQPHRIARLVGQWLARGDARHAIFNLKLPMKQRHSAVTGAMDEVRRRCARAGQPVHLRCRQLYHDREEVSVFATTVDVTGGNRAPRGTETAAHERTSHGGAL